jgi:sugar lactone lactonase YvrE
MSPYHVFTGPAYESRSGRLYFPDRTGVHVLDGDVWSYQHLYLENIEKEIYFDDVKAFHEPEFTEDSEGRVYVWSSWGQYGLSGTIGFFIHDGEEWKHVQSPTYGEQDWLRSVIPLVDGGVLLCPQSGQAYVRFTGKPGNSQEALIKTDIALLGASKGEERKKAYKRLQKALPQARPILSEMLKLEVNGVIVSQLIELLSMSLDGYTLVSARCFCRDAEGNYLVRADTGREPSGETVKGGWYCISPDGHVSRAPAGMHGWNPDSTFLDSKGRLYFAEYEKGCVMFVDGKVAPVTEMNQTTYNSILGEDKDGRLYLSSGPVVAAFNPGNADTRLGLKTEAYDVIRSEISVSRDSHGRIWAKLAGSGHPFLSVFDKGKWMDWVSPDGNAIDRISFFQPLKNGRLIVSTQQQGRTYFFDGSQWSSYNTLRACIESRFRKLVETIDNLTPCRSNSIILRLDADGKIWVAEGRQCAVYNGIRWIDVAESLNRVHPHFDTIEHCMPVDGGRKMLVSNGDVHYFVRIREGNIELERFALLPDNGMVSTITTRAGLWLDSQDRVWLPFIHDSLLVNEGGVETMTNTGYPRFEDSGGCIWFLDPYSKRISVIGPEGSRGVLLEDSLYDMSAIVEHNNTFWIGTMHGLLHVAKEKTGDGYKLKVLAHYKKDVPNQECLQMFVDHEDYLWFFGMGSPNFRLYRVRLPL